MDVFFKSYSFILTRILFVLAVLFWLPLSALSAPVKGEYKLKLTEINGVSYDIIAPLAFYPESFYASFIFEKKGTFIWTSPILYPTNAPKLDLNQSRTLHGSWQVNQRGSDVNGKYTVFHMYSYFIDIEYNTNTHLQIPEIENQNISFYTVFTGKVYEDGSIKLNVLSSFFDEEDIQVASVALKFEGREITDDEILESASVGGEFPPVP